MYCPTCGAQATEGLKFCKRCGANLATAKESSVTDFKKLEGMFWAISVFGFISLTVLIGSAIPLVALHAHPEIILAVMVFGGAAIALIATLLIRQLSRLISAAKGDDRAIEPARRVNTSEFSQPQIAAPPKSFSSVTENTTRTFERVEGAEQILEPKERVTR